MDTQAEYEIPITRKTPRHPGQTRREFWENTNSRCWLWAFLLLSGVLVAVVGVYWFRNCRQWIGC